METETKAVIGLPEDFDRRIAEAFAEMRKQELREEAESQYEIEELRKWCYEQVRAQFLVGTPVVTVKGAAEELYNWVKNGY